MTEGAAFRQAIEADRADTRARVLALRSEIDGIASGSSDANTDDEHDPEGATLAFERARASALLAHAEAHLTALDRASSRLAAGVYCECERCHGPIAADRLAARPATVTCIGCATPPSPG